MQISTHFFNRALIRKVAELISQSFTVIEISSVNQNQRPSNLLDILMNLKKNTQTPLSTSPKSLKRWTRKERIMNILPFRYILMRKFKKVLETGKIMGISFSVKFITNLSSIDFSITNADMRISNTTRIAL